MFGKSRDQFLLKEGIIEIGVFASPATLTPATFLAGWTSTGDLGYFQQGTMNVELNRTYAEFLAGTPGKLIRKDLIRKQFQITMQAAQYNADLLALAQGLDVDSGGGLDMGWIGSDEPTQVVNGYRITTALVDGRALYIAVWAGQVTSEAVGPKLPGTAHSTFDLKVEAFEHEDFTTSPDDTHNYGAWVIEQ